MRIYTNTLITLLTFCALFWGCADSSDLGLDSGEEKSGLRPWISQSFDRHYPMSDDFFNDIDALSQQGVQAFLERSPYGRSWLASHTISGDSASAVIHQIAVESGPNPILLLSRMQVESSLISATSAPSAHLIDRAMGCGCPDGYACAAEYLGLYNQIKCAARKFRELYQRSQDGSGWWRKGLEKQTLDQYWINPKSHATAALYAYTPWVLQGSGGTWLAWKAVQLFDQHAYDFKQDKIGQASGESSAPPTVNMCGRFSDYGPSDEGWGAVEAAAVAGWVSGCDGSKFCPDSSISRAQAASVIHAALELPPGSRSGLTDLREHWARDAIESVISAGIMSGCNADQFCPDEPLTRAQAAVIIAKAIQAPGSSASPFTDVPPDHWAANSIAGLAERGDIGGCSSGEFCPDALVRRWIYVTWLVNALDLAYKTCQ